MSGQNIDPLLLSLLEASVELHLLLLKKGYKLSDQNKELHTKALKGYTERIRKQIDGEHKDLDMRSLSVQASVGGGDPILQNQIVYLDPLTSHMNFSTAVRMEANNPATNYSTVWVMTPNDQAGDVIVRPYILPGMGTNAMGATLHLEESHHADVWLVKFRWHSKPLTVYTETDTSGDSTYVGLYVTPNDDHIYLMPCTDVGIQELSEEFQIVGVPKGNLDIYVWEIQIVPPTYLLPVPDPEMTACEPEN